MTHKLIFVCPTPPPVFLRKILERRYLGVDLWLQSIDSRKCEGCERVAAFRSLSWRGVSLSLYLIISGCGGKVAVIFARGLCFVLFGFGGFPRFQGLDRILRGSGESKFGWFVAG